MNHLKSSKGRKNKIIRQTPFFLLREKFCQTFDDWAMLLMITENMTSHTKASAPGLLPG